MAIREEIYLISNRNHYRSLVFNNYLITLQVPVQSQKVPGFSNAPKCLYKTVQDHCV